MFKTRAALLGALAAVIAGGSFVSQAVAAGPYWYVNGAKLTQGAKQLKQQTKGIFIQKSTIGGSSVTAECRNSQSEGVTIEGVGAKPGQGKGRLLYSQCKLNVPNCKVVEPLVTTQVKAQLATYKGQVKYALVFEPTEGTTFITYKIVSTEGSCLIAAEYSVKGSIAAAIPGEIEAQEGLMSFPEIPISKVVVGQQEKLVGLRLGESEYKIAAIYGARLATNEKFGVFGV